MNEATDTPNIVAGPTAPLAPPGRVLAMHDVLALLALGLVLGLAARGHYAMPYSDFAEFVDCGHAWLAGQLPPTFKRAPVYPLLVVGASKLIGGPVPEIRVAEWLNALLLPVNGLLVYIIGRRWFGPAARWAAAWVLLLPMSLYCTAHLIVEPLLAASVLLTIALTQLGTRWAYAAAALATLVRYDAAGLIVGVAAADWLHGRSRWRIATGSALASAPLAIILVLTALTWSERSKDHYLARIAAEPVFAPLTTAALIGQTAFEPHPPQLPVWLAEAQPLLKTALFDFPLLLAAIGAAVALWTRWPAAIALLCALAGYWLVHAVFPVQVDRFGYPPAGSVVLLTGVGLREAALRLSRRRIPPAAVTASLLVIGAVSMAVLVNESQAWVTSHAGDGRFAERVLLLVPVVLGLLWGGPLLARRPLAQAVLLLAALTLATFRLGQISAKLGTGQEMRDVVVAANWIRQHIPEQRVLYSEPGLLRLLVGRTPADRFVGFDEVSAESWPQIVDECRRRNISYILWHDALEAVHGGYYADRMRLGRFAGLRKPEQLSAVRVVRQFTGQPNVVIVEILPQ